MSPCMSLILLPGKPLLTGRPWMGTGLSVISLHALTLIRVGICLLVACSVYSCCREQTQLLYIDDGTYTIFDNSTNPPIVDLECLVEGDAVTFTYGDTLDASVTLEYEIVSRSLVPVGVRDERFAE